MKQPMTETEKFSLYVSHLETLQGMSQRIAHSDSHLRKAYEAEVERKRHRCSEQDNDLNTRSQELLKFTEGLKQKLASFGVTESSSARTNQTDESNGDPRANLIVVIQEGQQLVARLESEVRANREAAAAVAHRALQERAKLMKNPQAEDVMVSNRNRIGKLHILLIVGVFVILGTIALIAVT